MTETPASGKCAKCGHVAAHYLQGEICSTVGCYCRERTPAPPSSATERFEGPIILCPKCEHHHTEFDLCSANPPGTWTPPQAEERWTLADEYAEALAEVTALRQAHEEDRLEVNRLERLLDAANERYESLQRSAIASAKALSDKLDAEREERRRIEAELKEFYRTMGKMKP